MTRLCHQCQSMIAPIAPTARLAVNTALAEPQAFRQPEQSVATAGRTQGYEAFIPEPPKADAQPIPQRGGFDLLDIESADEAADLIGEEDGEGVFYPDVEIAPEGPGYETYSEASAQVRPDEIEQPVLLDSHDQGLIAQTQEMTSLRRNGGSDSLLVGDGLLAEVSSDAEAVEVVGGEQQIITNAPAPDELSDESARAQSRAPDYMSAVDPWDDPLPAWDQSQNEWPIMLAPEKKSKAGRLAVPIAAALIIAAAAAVYFLFIQPRGGVEPDESKLEQKPLVVAPPAAEQATPADTPATQPQTLPVEVATQNKSWGSNAAQAGAAIENNTGGGRFSLQVASMPNEAAANKMAAELSASGIPAYVVAADLGKRGVWYRVRVGKFATAEEAQRFAASRGLRADVARD